MTTGTVFMTRVPARAAPCTLGGASSGSAFYGSSPHVFDAGRDLTATTTAVYSTPRFYRCPSTARLAHLRPFSFSKLPWPCMHASEAEPGSLLDRRAERRRCSVASDAAVTRART